MRTQRDRRASGFTRFGGAFLALALAILLSPAATAAEDPPPGEYTYQQARALGIATVPTPAEVGLPQCPPPGDWPGYSSADELTKAETAAPDAAVCAVDPTSTIVSLGRPASDAFPAPLAPDASAHREYAGAQTDQFYQGGKIEAELGNPTINHNEPSGKEEFVVARVIAKNAETKPKWIEAGWGEFSWTSGHNVYTYDPDTASYTFYTAYGITAGNYYAFRVMDCGDSSQSAVCAGIFWNGGWQQLTKKTGYMRCENYNDGTGHCLIEEFLEVYSNDGTPYPAMQAPVDGPGVNFRDSKIRVDSNTWDTWDANKETVPNEDAPYSPVCWQSMWDKFRAGKNLHCAASDLAIGSPPLSVDPLDSVDPVTDG